MKIVIYDPAMCCASGVCGPSVDPRLTKIQEILRKIEQAGVTVERYNLSNEPRAFVDNTEVGELLRTGGNGVLPLTFVDGKLLAKGNYPTTSEFSKILNDAGISVELEKSGKKDSGCSCGPKCC